jgi:hypothetical protein
VLGELIFVHDDCPLPIAPQDRIWTFVDVSKHSVLALAIDPNAVTNVCDELRILEKAIPHLAHQPPDLMDKLVARIIYRVLDLSTESRNKLHHIPFVPVSGIPQRSAPYDLIDPQSKLAQLFDSQDAQLPAGRFRDGPFLSVMQSQGFFQRDLTPQILKDRIIYIAANPCVPSIFVKAKTLLRLLDERWLSQFNTIPGLATAVWLPTIDKGLCRANQCRDTNEDKHLFDLVLAVVDMKLISTDLRVALGWRELVPVNILISQFRLTVDDGRLRGRAERLMKLIKSLATHSANGGISPDDLATLKEIVGCKPWIPVAPKELVATRYAIFTVDAKFGGLFKVVPRSLAEDKSGKFLERMGCTER